MSHGTAVLYCARRPLWQQQQDAAFRTILLPASSRRHDPLQLQLTSWHHCQASASGRRAACCVCYAAGQLSSLCPSALTSRRTPDGPSPCLGVFPNVWAVRPISFKMNLSTTDPSLRTFTHVLSIQWRLLWLRRSVVRLSLWSLGFDRRSVHVRFVVDRVAVGQVFLRLLPFYRMTIIPPTLHTHISITYNSRYITFATDSFIT